MIPDLAKELAYWAPRLNLQKWTITMVYKDEVRHPETGQSAWGMCTPNARAKTATIEIRRPRTAADIAEVHETIVHELLHCVHAAAEIGVEEEERIVWTLAPLLADLRTSEPVRARVLMRAIAARPKTVLLVHRARAEGKAMDPKLLAALAAKLLEMADLPEEAKSIVQEILKAATPAEAPPGDTEPPLAQDKPPADTSGKPPGDDKPAMGMTENPEDKRYRLLAEKQVADRAAAVDGILKTRPDLSEKQRTRLRTLGNAEGIAALNADLEDLVPAPKPAAAGEQSRARMGLDKPPATKTGAKKNVFRPSGNAASMTRLRVIAEESDEITAPGCVLHDEAERQETGKLLTMSIWDALPALRKSVEANVRMRAQRTGAAGGES